MKKKKFIIIGVVILLILIVMAIVIMTIANRHNDIEEEKFIVLSNEEINNMNIVMSDKLQDFAIDISKNKVINAKKLNDLENDLKNEIGYDVELSMEAQMIKKNDNQSDSTSNQEILAETIYEGKNNDQLMDEIEKNGEVKMSSNDIFSISVTLKNKKLLKGGQPYASHSMVIN